MRYNNGIRSKAECVVTSTAGPVPTSPVLYLLGLIVALSGVAAIDISSQLPTVTVATLSVTCVGYAYSYITRQTQQNGRLLQWFCIAFSVFLLYGSIGPQVDRASIVLSSDQASVGASLLLAGLASLWSWMVSTNDRVVFSTIIALASIGLIVPTGLNDQVSLCVVVFIVSAILLLVHHNMLRITSEAGAIATSPQLAGGQLVVGLVCAAVVLAVAFVATGPTERLLEQIPFVDTLHKMATYKQGISGSTLAATPVFSDDDTIDVGAASEWPTSSEILMRAESKDNQPHYWKGRTYDLYTGSGWSSSVADVKVLITSETRNGGWRDYHVSSPQPAVRPFGNILRTSMSVRGVTGQFYGPGHVDVISFRNLNLGPIVSAPDESYSLSDGGLLGIVYSMTSTGDLDIDDPAVKERSLRSIQRPPAAILNEYASLHENGTMTADDVAYFKSQAALAISRYPVKSPSEYAQVQAIEQLVVRRCIYSLKIPPPDARYDHVRNFLEHTHKGYCDLFASAVAVLCRSVGIPTRLVTGFAPGVRDGVGFNIRSSDKHAWLEVYFASVGWVRCDPTEYARSEAAVSTPPKNAFDTLYDWFGNLPTVPVWERVTSAIVAVLLCCVMWIEGKEKMNLRTARRRRGKKATPSASDEYNRLRHCLVRMGAVSPTGETPLEFCVRATHVLVGNPDIDTRDEFTALIRKITEKYAIQRYSMDSNLGDSISGNKAIQQTLEKLELISKQVKRRQIMRAITMPLRRKRVADGH